MFDYGAPVVRGKGNSKRNTDEIRSQAPWRWPSEIQDTLNFQPRNPDIVAYSKARSEWRFCEVKGPGDRINRDQLKALAVLYFLTGAPVAVLRVVEVATDSAVQMRSAEIAYRKRAPFAGNNIWSVDFPTIRITRRRMIMRDFELCKRTT